MFCRSPLRRCSARTRAEILFAMRVGAAVAFGVFCYRAAAAVVCDCTNLTAADEVVCGKTGDARRPLGSRTVPGSLAFCSLVDCDSAAVAAWLHGSESIALAGVTHSDTSNSSTRFPILAVVGSVSAASVHSRTGPGNAQLRRIEGRDRARIRTSGCARQSQAFVTAGVPGCAANYSLRTFAGSQRGPRLLSPQPMNMQLRKARPLPSIWPRRW